MAGIPIVKITLDRLCEYAELAASVKSDKERFDIDEKAYDFLAFSRFSKDETTRFMDNYRRMRKEFIH